MPSAVCSNLKKKLHRWCSDLILLCLFTTSNIWETRMDSSRGWRRCGWIAVMVLFGSALPAFGIPAFARKYNLRCSDCHEAWPKLNNFGQTFKDNGYQLMTGRDTPIFQQGAYFPVAFRTFALWHRESTVSVAVDTIPGNPAAGQMESPVSKSGFNISGLTIWAAGTVAKNISFGFQTEIDNSGTATLATYFARFDNLLGSPWLNVKVGKFELDIFCRRTRTGIQQYGWLLPQLPFCSRR